MWRDMARYGEIWRDLEHTTKHGHGHVRICLRPCVHVCMHAHISIIPLCLYAYKTHTYVPACILQTTHVRAYTHTCTHARAHTHTHKPHLGQDAPPGPMVSIGHDPPWPRRRKGPARRTRPTALPKVRYGARPTPNHRRTRPTRPTQPLGAGPAQHLGQGRGEGAARDQHEVRRVLQPRQAQHLPSSNAGAVMKESRGGV
jgi:hypothetical protein